MKYTLGEGECELAREVVTGLRDGKQVPESWIVVTDRRVALLVPKPIKGLFLLFGFLAKRMPGPLELTHQIKRQDFAGVEEPHRGMLVFHSKAEGYARTSFEVYDASPLSAWQARLQAWVENGALA